MRLGVRGSSSGGCGITMPAAALVAAAGYWVVNLAFGRQLTQSQ
ncbi:hypothetical protein ACFWVU_04700 [Streptomyces sp. NPDC058686]